jgi:hypothetical protein
VRIINDDEISTVLEKKKKRKRKVMALEINNPLNQILLDHGSGDPL